MNGFIFAHTEVGSSFPGYMNFTKLEDGRVQLIVRSPAKVTTGAYLCGHAEDKGKHGRCTPGDENCNNYCNKASGKGPMANKPKDCETVRMGETARIIISAADFDTLCTALNEVRDAAT